jgi:hypothetical protein
MAGTDSAFAWYSLVVHELLTKRLGHVRNVSDAHCGRGP